MRSRSAMRLLSARIGATPRSSALLAASASRAAVSRLMARNTKNATNCRARYGGTSSRALCGLKVIASPAASSALRSEEHTSELQSRVDLVCRLLLEKKKKDKKELLRVR